MARRGWGETREPAWSNMISYDDVVFLLTWPYFMHVWQHTLLVFISPVSQKSNPIKLIGSRSFGTWLHVITHECCWKESFIRWGYLLIQIVLFDFGVPQIFKWNSKNAVSQSKNWPWTCGALNKNWSTNLHWRSPQALHPDPSKTTVPFHYSSGPQHGDFASWMGGSWGFDDLSNKSEW